MNRRVRWMAVLAVLATLIAACGDDTATAPVTTETAVTSTTVAATTSNAAADTSEIEVDIKGFAFQPPSLTITEGTTVTWRNQDGVRHTTTGDTWAQTLASGDTFSVTFATAGTYSYMCTIHPTMTATITVTG